MRSILLALCTCALTACAGMATTYQPASITTFGGYRASAEAPNRWRVSAVSNGFAEEDLAIAMTLYRGAVIAKAAGFPYMQVVDFRIVQEVGGSIWARGVQNTELKIVGIHDAAAPLRCEATARFQANCRTLGVDATLALYAPTLQQSPAQTAAEVESARQSPPRP
jgi:hypothetical protein